MVDDNVPDDHGIHNIIARSNDVSQSNDRAVLRDDFFELFLVNSNQSIQDLSDDFHFSFNGADAKSLNFFPSQKSLTSRMEMRISSISFCGSCGIDTSLCLIQCVQKNLISNATQRDKVHMPVEDFFQSIFEV